MRARWVAAGVVTALALGAGGWLALRAPRDPVAAARAFYAAQPRYLQPVPYTPVPEGLPDLRSETCGSCHPEFYAEWLASTHARAWLDDAQFQEELKKSRSQKGRDVTWMCVNCHTPLENQLERLVVGLDDGDHGRPRYVANPHFDATLQHDAIGCATCHVRDGVVLGPYGDTAAPHPVRQAPELLGSGVCTQCHQAQAVFAEIPLGCFFDTGRELAEGPYADEGYTCQRCHMPEVERPLGPASPTARATRRHWFGGSGIPKRPEDEPAVAAMRAHYPDGARLEWVELPASAAAGQPLRLRFSVTNAGAGHRLPTGDPERHLELTARVRGPHGAVLAERTETLGAVYQWDPIELLEDTRLAPRESRSFELELTAPALGPLTLELTGATWRMHEKDFDYHQLEGRYVRGRVFFAEERELPVE